MAQADHLGDLLVGLRDVLRQLVDAGDRVAQVFVDTLLHRLDLLRRRVEARRRLAGARQHHLPRRAVAGMAGDVDHRVEELVGGVAHALLAERERALELLQVVEPRLVGLRQRPAALHLLGQELVVGAADGRHLDALAVVARAGVLRPRRVQLRLLARIALDVGIGDVVAGDLQLRIAGLHRPRADHHQRRGCHALTPRQARPG